MTVHVLNLCCCQPCLALSVSPLLPPRSSYPTSSSPLLSQLVPSQTGEYAIYTIIDSREF